MKKYILLYIISICSPAFAADYQSLLAGKTLVMKGAVCAGLSLGRNSGLSAEQPMGQCSVDLPARLEWISPDTFIMVEKSRPDDTSPPRVFISKVKLIKGKEVVLTDIWTGWGKSRHEDTAYTIK